MAGFLLDFLGLGGARNNRAATSSNGITSRSFSAFFFLAVFLVVAMSQTPTIFESPEFYAYCHAVGFIVVTWAYIEHILDMTIAIIYQNCGGNIVQDELPRNLTRKIGFVKRALRKIDILEPHKAEGLALMSRIASLKQRRHDPVHGAITSLSAKDGVFNLKRLEAKGTMHEVHDVTFDLNQFPSFAKELTDLAKDLMQYCLALKEAYPRLP